MTTFRKLTRIELAAKVRSLRNTSTPFNYCRLSSGAVDVHYKVGNGFRNYSAPSK
jgi:hypothetical protein